MPSADNFISTEAQLRERGARQGRQWGEQARQWWEGGSAPALQGSGLRVDPTTALLWEPQHSSDSPALPLDYGLGSARLPSQATLSDRSGSAAQGIGELGSGTYPDGVYSPATLRLWAAQQGTGAYPNPEGQWINTRPGRVQPFGDIRPSRFALEDYPAALQSAYGPTTAAYDRLRQGFVSVPVDETGRREIFSPVSGYQVPSLATLQAAQWARGVSDSITQAPAALWNGLRDVSLLAVDGPRLLFDSQATPYSGITRGIMDGRITWGSAGSALMVGLLENSPAGILTNMGWGTPESLYSAGGALGGAAFGAALTGVARTGLHWAQRLNDYSLEFPSLPASGYARGQMGAAVIPTVRNLRAEVKSLLPEDFTLVRLQNGGTAILRYGDDVYYSVPKDRYSLIPQLREMDTMGEVFRQRVQDIADRFDATSDLSEGQVVRLGKTAPGWKYNQYTRVRHQPPLFGRFDDSRLVKSMG